MDFGELSNVVFGDEDSLSGFLFENGTQHKAFQETLMDSGTSVPVYPIMDIDINNLDDWQLVHQLEHQAFAQVIGLENPFGLLDSDWNKEDSFYDWIATHTLIHQQIASVLGLT